MGENRELLLAITLSILVLVGWQLYIGVPQVEQTQQQQTQQAQQQGTAGAPPVPQQGAPAPSAGGVQPSVPGSLPATVLGREQAVAATPRIPLDSPELKGSINLKGGRIDDLSLKNYKVSVKKGSPSIALLSPSGSANPYYAEYGWSGTPGDDLKLPNATTIWTAPDGARLTPQTPVTLTYDNGEGLVFERTISLDEDFLFTIRQSVRNNSGDAVTLHPYALISRHGRPDIEDFFVLHEGLIGSFSEDGGSTEVDYSDLEDEGERRQTFKSSGGWLGFVDKYWAAVIVPDQARAMTARFSNTPVGAREIFQSDYLLDAQTIPSGATAETTGRLFAGAKVVSIIDQYEENLGIKSFGLLIDWGWFYFITKPMFQLLDWLYRLVGNFGVAILLATVLIKLALFPLANKSYVSMSRMKLLQPEMVKIRERYSDDRVKQQQAMMELYKKEKVNPMAGCLPIVIQIPVFFALYKVLFGTIEMRHAPFFGWIQDLAAPDPTSLFNLFGLIPWDPPSFLLIGIWPIIMGVTMFIQMRLNPTPPDPVQAQIFTWMPLFFTFLLASFPAGLVIYWAWNNLLSIIQQAVIMRRQGVKIELWDNLKSMFGKGKKKEEEAG